MVFPGATKKMHMWTKFVGFSCGPQKFDRAGQHVQRVVGAAAEEYSEGGENWSLSLSEDRFAWALEC
jgi:hypothetical protein